MSQKLFVDQTIEVNATRAALWQVITDPRYTAQWAREFTGGAPFSIESHWELGDDVLWKDENGTTLVEGEVTANEKLSLLRFTVYAANSPHTEVTTEDGITWQLTEIDQKLTKVRARQGDFGSVEGGEENYRQTEQTWSRIMPIVKKLAESL